jgi:hypothetical protein
MAAVANAKLAGFLLLLLFLVSILGLSIVVAQEEDLNVGALKVFSVQYPRTVAPSARFSLVIDVRYAIHSNSTVKLALFEGSRKNLGAQLWQSGNAVLTQGGDRLWGLNLTAPPDERTNWTLTVFAYYLENGTWQYFTDNFRGPGFAEITLIVAKSATLQIELGVPSLSVQVDGSNGKTSSAGTLALPAAVGVTHEITVPSIQEYENGTRLIFAGWRDKSNDTKRTLRLDGDTKIVGSYRRQYLLRMNSVVPDYSRSVWYDAGANVSVSVAGSVPMPSLLGSLGLRYVFTGWSGEVVSRSTTVTLIMDKPKTENANFAVDFTPIIVPMILVVGTVGGVFLALRMRSRVSRIAGAEEAGWFCDGCGEPIEKDWAHCTHCGRELNFSKPVQGSEGHVPDFRNETVGDDNKKGD